MSEFWNVLCSFVITETKTGVSQFPLFFSNSFLFLYFYVLKFPIFPYRQGVSLLDRQTLRDDSTHEDKKKIK